VRVVSVWVVPLSNPLPAWRVSLLLSLVRGPPRWDTRVTIPSHPGIELGRAALAPEQLATELRARSLPLPSFLAHCLSWTASTPWQVAFGEPLSQVREPCPCNSKCPGKENVMHLYFWARKCHGPEHGEFIWSNPSEWRPFVPCLFLIFTHVDGPAPLQGSNLCSEWVRHSSMQIANNR
jgi:hypothetical protein